MSNPSKAWERKREAYVDSGLTKDDMNLDERISRRVLRALGLRNSDKDLYAAETAILGEPDRESPLWMRTARILES